MAPISQPVGGNEALIKWLLDPSNLKDLNQRIIIKTVVLFSLIFIAVGFVSVRLFGGNKEKETPDDKKKRTKKLSWCISLLNSGAMTILGAIYLYLNVTRHENFFFYGPEPSLIFYSVAPLEVFTCIWFALACIYDLLFGLLFYPSHIQFLTGWFHHGIFIWMMYFSCTGSGLFLTAHPFASAFVYMLIEELPTFLLALGSVLPDFRTDLGFGVTFFLLRICYHAYIVSFAYISKFHTPGMCLYYLTLTMHLNWFYGWIVSYFMPQAKKNKKMA